MRLTDIITPARRLYLPDWREPRDYRPWVAPPRMSASCCCGVACCGGIPDPTQIHVNFAAGTSGCNDLKNKSVALPLTINVAGQWQYKITNWDPTGGGGLTLYTIAITCTVVGGASVLSISIDGNKNTNPKCGISTGTRLGLIVTSFVCSPFEVDFTATMAAQTGLPGCAGCSVGATLIGSFTL